MKLGEFEIKAVETGRFRLDGGAMFGVVPKVLWSRTNPADESNRIAMAMRALYLEGNGRRLLIDGGSGTATVALTIAQPHLNFNGTCHGGVIFALADTAFGLASNSHGVIAAGIDARFLLRIAGSGIACSAGACIARCRRRAT